MKAALNSPRIHTEGNNSLAFEKSWPAQELEQFRKLGYDVSQAANANISAVAYEESELRFGRR